MTNLTLFCHHRSSDSPGTDCTGYTSQDRSDTGGTWHKYIWFVRIRISKSLKMSADKTYWHTRRDTRGLWVVASPVSSLLRLTASSTTVLWSTGSRLEERPRQRRTRGPGEGDITGQDWSRGIGEHRVMSGSHGHWLRSQIMKLLSRKTLT